jgi:hypothetical protein
MVQRVKQTAKKFLKKNESLDLGDYSETIKEGKSNN